jgi:hypothetical protein
MADMETHGYPLGSAAASIVGIADSLLEREDLDEDLVTRLRAIRDLALELAREAGRGEPKPAVPTLLEKVRRDGRGDSQASRVMKEQNSPYLVYGASAFVYQCPQLSAWSARVPTEPVCGSGQHRLRHADIAHEGQCRPARN